MTYTIQKEELYSLNGKNKVKDLIEAMNESNTDRVDILITECFYSCDNSMTDVSLDELKNTKSSTIEDFIYQHNLYQILPDGLEVEIEDTSYNIEPSK
jgi:hypothetical protein